jgi:uncharacterized protein YdeI (YjbR/CyaY-like superfamily)
MDADIFEFNYEKSDGIWVRFFKKGSGVASIKNSEALEVALS